MSAVENPNPIGGCFENYLATPSAEEQTNQHKRANRFTESSLTHPLPSQELKPDGVRLLDSAQLITRANAQLIA